MLNPSYAWRGIDRQGRTINGVMRAPKKETVVQQLRAQRIRVTHLHRQFDLPPWLTLRSKARIHPQDIARITRQLATLLKAGVPLLQSLDIIHRGETGLPLQTLIGDLRQQVEAGAMLNQALKQHEIFQSLYCNLVAVGEQAGMLDLMLERLAHHLEKAEALRATLRSALFYPCAVLTIALAVLVIILVFVVPAFQTIFASFGAELPWLTRSVIGMSEAVQKFGLYGLIASVTTAGWLTHLIRRKPHWQKSLHRLWLRLPIAGPLLRHACTARWTRTLATLFGAGLPLTEALESTQGVTGNLLFQSATQSIQAQLMQGMSLSMALQSTSDLFPAMVSQMCAIGEESGALDHMLEKTAEYYEREVDQTVARLSTLLEPFIMVVLGLMIGGLVMALYLPIFQLGQVV
mgnify:CR=1 FL=1